MIVLQGLPEEQDFEVTAVAIAREINSRFKSVVSGVHELHLWSLVPDQVVGTLHVKFRDKKVSTTKRLGFFLTAKNEMSDMLMSMPLVVKATFTHQKACNNIEL